MIRAAFLCAAVALGANSVYAAEPIDNACVRVLTADMAQRVLSGAVEPATRNSESDMKMGTTVVSHCSYSLKSGGSTVSLLLRKAGSTEEAKGIFGSSKTAFKGQDVAGLGDAAYRTTTPAQLNVLKGRDWLIITAGTFPKGDAALQEKAAAEILKNLHD